jgi:Dynein heavy chain, N-terminal region 1
MHASFEGAGSIQQSLHLLRKYQSIVHRAALRNDLAGKVALIFRNYAREVAAVQELYEAHKHAPPIARYVALLLLAVCHNVRTRSTTTACSVSQCTHTRSSAE